MPTKVLLTNLETAEYLGVSTGQLRLSRHRGELFKAVPSPQFIKLGNAIRYRKEDLDNWINKYPRYTNTAQVKSNIKK